MSNDQIKTTDYRCTNGHDRCYGGVSAGPDCPYCVHTGGISDRPLFYELLWNLIDTGIADKADMIAELDLAISTLEKRSAENAG